MSLPTRTHIHKRSAMAAFVHGSGKYAANSTPLTPITFLERTAAVFPDRASIIDVGGRRFEWAQTLVRCRRLASALGALGVSAGDMVSVFASNLVAMYEMHFGVPMTGAILNTLNTRLDAHAVAVLLCHSGAKVLFVDRQFLSLMFDALVILSSFEGQATRKVPVIVVITNSMNSHADYKEPEAIMDYEELLEKGDPSFQTVCNSEWQPISLNYTSGTTSSPKGVVYTHRGAYLNSIMTIFLWNMKPSPVYLWALPMFHCNGWCFTWSVAAQAGTNILIQNVTAKNIFDAIVEYQVTHLCGAPTVISIILNADESERKPFPHRVEFLVGAAPPPAPILARMEELGFRVTHGYGLTETYGGALSCEWKPEWDPLPLKERARLKSRQGVPHLGFLSADIKDPSTMLSVPKDGHTIGEIMLRGSTIMDGYFKDEEATKKAFEGGWFHTGDLGVMHPDGYIEIKDRSKDIIISGGENISSIEVESVLYDHPFVSEAAVVARPDDYWGETPCAFITLKESVDSSLISSEGIIEYCRKKLPRYMVPRTVVFGSLPKTATGKIQKYVLRETARKMGSLAAKSKL